MKVHVRCCAALAILMSGGITASAQSVPCAAITRDPQVLEALLDSHSKDSDSVSNNKDDTINTVELQHLRFGPIVIQPGDALYVEYRGRDFIISADFASGDMTVFDSSPKGSYEQWRKGILPLDMFRATLSQKLIRLRATAKNPSQVFFRNIKIIRAGRPVFEFAKISTYGRPQIKTAVQRELPCKAFDDAPEPAMPMHTNYSIPNSMMPGNFSGVLVQPMLPPFPMMMQGTTTTGTDTNHYKFMGKELDSETGLYNFGARYYEPALGRFMQPDPLILQKQKLVDPQQWNMYAFVRNNPLRFTDPTGKAVQLSDNEADRKKQLAAAQQAVGKAAGSYLYDNTDKNGHHYIGIYAKGPDGKGPEFNSLNGAANKLNGIIQDSRIAFVSTVSPGTNVLPNLSPNGLIGPTTSGMTPGGSRPVSNGNEVLYLTSGDPGKLDGTLTSTGRDATITPGDVFSHEIGHIDARWFHGGVDSDGDSVRMENQTRQLNGEPTRNGHSAPNDVPLQGVPY